MVPGRDVAMRHSMVLSQLFKLIRGNVLMLASKVCHECVYWEKLKDSNEYSEFIANHECCINHKGSAGSMEAAGLVQCFMASEKDRQLHYQYFIGDGDSKSHVDIVENDPYNGIVMEKLECDGKVGVCWPRSEESWWSSAKAESCK